MSCVGIGSTIRNLEQSGGGSTESTETFTLSSTDIANGYVVLGFVPLVAGNVKLFVKNGLNQVNGTDFSITADNAGKRLSWVGLGMAPILSAGNVLVVSYFH